MIKRMEKADGRSCWNKADFTDWLDNVAFGTPARTPSVGSQQSHKKGILSRSGTRSYSFALSQDTRVDLVFHGEITEESLTALRDYIDITVRVLGKKSEPKE